MDLREASSAGSRRHPWEVARFRFFARALRDAGVLAQARRVLDVGSGDAWFSRGLLPLLPQGARIDCVDSEYDAQALAAEQPPGLALHRTRPEGKYDLIVLLDVLEHVRDDAAFLREFVDEALVDGGRVLISVPAWQPLYTAHDTFLQHFRRYAPSQARGVLEGAGLRVDSSGGLFHSLLAPRALEKARERLHGAPEHVDPGIAWRHGAGLTRVVQAALSVDNAASRWLARAGVQAPGLSWWALCHK